jgi:hypothetical protein
LSLDPAVLALAEHWESVEELLAAGPAARLHSLVDLLPSPEAGARQQATAAAGLAALLAGALPRDHPVWLAFIEDDEVRYLRTPEETATPRVFDPALRERLYPGLRRHEVDRAAAGDRSQDIVEAATARLLAFPCLRPEQLGGDHGGDPRLRHLIKLDGADGPCFPAFQFDGSGRPFELVLEVNALLDAAEDPWGVADWWLGRNARLARTPADSIGTGLDSVLLEAAYAAAGED